MKIGTATTGPVALNATAGSPWEVLTLPTPVWYKNFLEEALDVEIIIILTAGTLLIDDVILSPGTNFDGSWYWLIGARTPFLREDEFTFTHTVTESIIQRWFWRMFGRYLPHSGAPTWAEPAA